MINESVYSDSTRSCASTLGLLLPSSMQQGCVVGTHHLKNSLRKTERSLAGGQAFVNKPVMRQVTLGQTTRVIVDNTDQSYLN